MKKKHLKNYPKKNVLPVFMDGKQKKKKNYPEKKMFCLFSWMEKKKKKGFAGFHKWRKKEFEKMILKLLLK